MKFSGVRATHPRKVLQIMFFSCYSKYFLLPPAHQEHQAICAPAVTSIGLLSTNTHQLFLLHAISVFFSSYLLKQLWNWQSRNLAEELGQPAFIPTAVSCVLCFFFFLDLEYLLEYF